MTEYHEESMEEKYARWQAEHEDMVASGQFDELPMFDAKPGDIVAVRTNDLIHQIYEVDGDRVVAGYDTQDGHKVRLELTRADVKSPEDYQNLLYKRRKLDKQMHVTVEGNVTTLWKGPKEDNPHVKTPETKARKYGGTDNFIPLIGPGTNIPQ